MARILPSPFYDGYSYRHGVLDCTFRYLDPTARWTIHVVDARTNSELFSTVPLPTKCDAYALAQRLCSAIIRDGCVFADLHNRNEGSLDADDASHHFTESAA